MKSTRKSLPLEQRASRSLLASGVRAGARLVVGISGGPDSTALLVILSSLNPGKPFDLFACIVDHGMRSPDEIEGDIRSVRELSEALGAEFRLLSVPRGECAGRARSLGLSLEEVARDLRLSLLRRAAGEIGADAVVLGHTADDQAETLLMRALTGSGVEGLSGIARRRDVFVRPLLSCRRGELLEYLKSRGITHRTDSTNNDPRFLRNRIRSTLIPALEEAYPGFRAGLASMARKLRLCRDMLAAEAGERLQWREDGGVFRIREGVFCQAPPALRAHSLMELYDRTRGSGAPRRLPFSFLSPALGSLLPDRLILEGHGIRLLREGGELVWERAVVMGGEKSYFIAVETDGSYIVSGAALRVDFSRESCEGIVVSCPRILESAISRPLVLRSRRGGDALPMTYGRKSVKELFSEWKVPRRLRALLPLLADRSGVVAVLGGAFGFPDIVRADARGGGDSVAVRVSRQSS